MGPGLKDLAAHNRWATMKLLGFCRELDHETLNSTVPGTFGTVLGTLQHIVDSEGSYVRRLTGAWPKHPWADDWDVDIPTLVQRAEILATTLEQFLSTDWDDERPGEAFGDDGTVFAVPAGIFLTQLIHHANEHRAHVCTILGANGIEDVDVSVWCFAETTSRSWITKPGA